MSVVIVTASDAQFFDWVQGTILSIREKPQGKNIPIAMFDLGCTPAQLDWLRQHVDLIREPGWDYPFPPAAKIPAHFRGMFARPFLRRYFENFEVYVWIDADAWVQDWNAVELYVQGARKRGMAIVAEHPRSNCPLFGNLAGPRKEVVKWYVSHFGPAAGEKMADFPVLNAGVFALRADAPHWQLWDECLGAGLKTSCSNLADQIAINLVVFQRGLLAQTELLPPWCNWMNHCGLPAWAPARKLLVDPYLPHTAVGILHHTGTKRERAELENIRGGKATVSLRYPAAEEQDRAGLRQIGPSPRTAYDYISPGLEQISLDDCFPNMVVADPSTFPWRYLRREIPHRWYMDRRAPVAGFVSRDEAHILYNSALQFQGQRALEIGCWVGWSTCHLARGGVLLDVVDPLLDRPEFHGTVVDSLSRAGVRDQVNLTAGTSPEKVRELAEREGRRWSMIFIDGNHEPPCPLNDTIGCEEFAAADAMILFHDLASPDVAAGLDYLRGRGWQTMVYQTMQIMGVAWRGNVRPVSHIPDPSVSWPWPAHLRHWWPA
jgi:hypothetical protein